MLLIKKITRVNLKAKLICSAIIIFLFFIVCAISFKLQTKTYQYSFELKDMELKSSDYDPMTGHISSEAVSDDFIAGTNAFSLPPGGYVLSISYLSDINTELLVQANNDCVFSVLLPASYGEVMTVTDSVNLVLPKGTDRGRIKLYKKEGGYIELHDITISSDHHIYRDYYLIIAFAGLIAMALIIITFLYDSLKLTSITWPYIVAFLVVMLIVNIPYITSGTYFEIDTQGHMKRIEGLYQGLVDGQIPVLIGPNYVNEYGELMVLQPNLFLYMPAILRYFNVSIPTAYNVYMILVNIMTAVFMAISAERIFHSVRWALVAAIIYMIEPFRLFVMLGLGGGAGMGTALIFFPLVISGLYCTLKGEGIRWNYMAIGMWGIINSHILASVLAVLYILFFTLMNYKELFNKKVIIAVLKAIAVFFLMSAGTIYPFIHFYFSDWNKDALTWNDFYHSSVGFNRLSFDLIALAVLIISFIGVRALNMLNKNNKLLFAFTFIVMLMAIRLFPFRLLGKLAFVDAFLSMMQYAQRFHLLASPFIALLAAQAFQGNVDRILLAESKEESRKHSKLVFLIIPLLITGIVTNFYEYYKPDKLYSDPLLGDINTLMEDYLPKGTLTEWYANDTGTFSDYDKISVNSYVKNFTDIDCVYSCKGSGEYFEFPLFYYEGYRAFDQDGRELLVEKGEKNRVRVYLTESDEAQLLHLEYYVNRSYTVVFIISLTISALWLLYSFYDFIKRFFRSDRFIKDHLLES